MSETVEVAAPVVDLGDDVFETFEQIKATGTFTNRPSIKRAMDDPVDPFPQPYRLGKQRVAWRRSERIAWLSRRKGLPPQSRRLDEHAGGQRAA